MRAANRVNARFAVIVGTEELERKVAEVHADMVTQYLNKLNCPSQQKLQLLDAVIAATN